MAEEDFRIGIVTTGVEKASSDFAKLRKVIDKSLGSIRKGTLTTRGEIQKWGADLKNVHTTSRKYYSGLEYWQKRAGKNIQGYSTLIGETSTATTKAAGKMTSGYGKVDTTVGKFTSTLQKNQRINQAVSKSYTTAGLEIERLGIYGKTAEKRIMGVNESQKKMVGTTDRIISKTRDFSSAEKYANLALKTTDKQFSKAAKSANVMALQSKAASDISARGIKSVNAGLRKQLEARVKQIETTRKLGGEVSASAMKQNNAILALNEGLKKHGTIWGKTKQGVSKTLGVIKKAGMIFLTTLGPIFLVGAALRTLKQAADWVYQPFIKFEDALYELRKTADLSIKSMLDIGDAITEMSKTIPIAAEELGKIAATAGRLGIRGRENILAFTETIAMMATATVLTADEAAESLARIRQAFDIPIENIENLGSVINELSNTTASNSRDIIASLSRIGAAGKLLGITADEAAAMGATLVSSGMDAARSGTRIRRMLSELASKSSKIEKEISSDFENWGKTLREDPMEALLQYMQWLGKIEDPIERSNTAQRHFGQVGRFAIETLSSNYEELIKNLESANEEMAFGTSLQREFEIATSKTSAQLQILTNRSEAARRKIGENLVPVLIKTKTGLATATEALADFTDGIMWNTKKIDESTSVIDIYYNEMKRLREETSEGIKKEKAYGAVFEITGKHLFTSHLRILQLKNITKDFTDAQEKGGITAKEFGKSIVSQIPGIGTVTGIYIDTKEAAEVLNEEILDMNVYMSLQSQIVHGATLAWQELYKYMKEVVGEEHEGTKETKLWIEYQNKIPTMLAKVDESIEDDTEKKKAKNEIVAIEEALERKARQSVLDSLQPYAEEGVLVGKTAIAYEEAKRYLSAFNIEEGKSVGLSGDSSAAFQLNNTLIEWRNKGIEDSTTLYAQLHKIFGENTDDMIEQGKIIDGLNEKNLMVIQNGENIIITSKDMNKYFVEGTDIVNEATNIMEKYGVAITDADDATYLLDRSTRNLISATNSLWNGLDSLVNTYSSGLEAQYKFAEIEKTMPRYIKQILNPMQDRIDLAKDFIEAGKGDVAAVHLATVADELYTKGLDETNKRKKTYYLGALEYVDSLIDAAGKAPSEIEEQKKAFGELFKPEAIMIDADTTLFQEKFKTEIEEAYLQKEYKILLIPEIVEPVEEGLEVEESMQTGGDIRKTGLYKLHEGEKVMSKTEVDKHYEDRSFNVNINGISLSEGYNAQKLLKDIEEYSLSRM